jgi:hypothetical protein
MYRVQFFCPLQSPYWQMLTEGLIWKTPRFFGSPQAAATVADSLIWKYHSARVIDAGGNVIYAI